MHKGYKNSGNGIFDIQQADEWARSFPRIEKLSNVLENVM